MAEAATTTATVDTTAATTTGATESNASTTQSASDASSQSQHQTDLEALIQRAVDRATNKLGNENKRLRADLEAAKKAKLSEDELRQVEMQEKEKEIADRERALTEKENRLVAIKAIKEAGLDDGSDASLAIVDFVMADTEEGIRDRVKAFDSLVKRIVQGKVDAVFKANGRTPGVGSETASNAGGSESVAVRMGRSTATTNKAAQAVLDHYLGGRK